MNELNEVVATRTLEVLDDRAQPVETVTVSLGCPKQEPDGQEWGCPYQIRGLGSERVFRALGLDGIQAMDGALTVLGGTLAGKDTVRAGRVRWAGSASFQRDFLHVHFLPEEGVLRELGPALATTTADEVKDLYARQGPMTISLGFPQQAPSGVWFCPYRVARLDLDCLWWVSGVDSMHAVQSALFMIHGFEDYNTELFRRHERWAGSHILGFPAVPHTP